MSNTQTAPIFRHIRRLVAARFPSRQSDMQLLQQFIADRDEDAFAALVQRHGAMVLGVTRSVLRHQQDAEDVFQAAFLVLARKAHTIRKQDSLSSWLYGVAYRLALKAKARAGRRREETSTDPVSASTIDDLTTREVRVILHEEMHGLTEGYRAALLLCYWEGMTRDEAAEQLGMSPGAFKKFLERARNLLGSRLVRRGLIPSSAIFAALLTENVVQAGLSSVITKTTTQAAVAFATGKSAGASVSAVALAEGAIFTMNITKWAATILAVILVAGLGTGFGLAAYQLVQEDAAGARGRVGADQAVQEPKGKGKEAEKPDNERIVGVWRITTMREGGNESPEVITKFGRATFTKDGAMILNIAGEEQKPGAYKLVEKGEIDLRPVPGQLNPGIYKFDGNDRLSICMGLDNRPTKFSGDKDSGCMLLVFERAKAGEEKVNAEELAKFKKEGGLDKIREAAARTQSVNNLKQIGLAMHNYHDQEKNFPAHAIYSKDGKTPLLSWRVAILPYIDQQALYNEFKLDEPWDSKHNKKLIAKMPMIYKMPGDGKAKEAKEGETFYQVITGPDTLFNGAKAMKITDITDGTSNTILVVEAKVPVAWSKPDDVPLPKDKDKRLPLGGCFSNGFHAVFCDGSVRMFPHDVDIAVFRAAITPAAGD
jgi:RNA polymerase sigma factor (sigma-70 family)